MAGRCVVVVNPRSQNGALGRKWADLGTKIHDTIGEFREAITRAPGDATRLAREALASGAELVVAVGGDGTIHEVANGFFDDTGAPLGNGAALGVVPFGTGGDFVRTAKIPKATDEAVRLLKEGSPRAIDMGRLEYQREGARAACMFINIASFGLAGLVDRVVNSSSKVLGGRISFMLGTARAALRYRNQQVRLRFDDDDRSVETRIVNVAVANGRFFGGGMKVAPDAELSDGTFDVVTIGDMSQVELLLNLHTLYRGTHLQLAQVSHRRATQVTAEAIDPDEQVLLDVDGEAPGRLPATFSIVPRALQLVCPAA